MHGRKVLTLKKKHYKEHFHETKFNVFNRGALKSFHSKRIYIGMALYIHGGTCNNTLHIPTRYIVQNKILNKYTQNWSLHIQIDNIKFHNVQN